ncbi:glycoside hydrolase [Actinoallomurus sp. NBC_01490]|uniref:sialidase family protein n=1 Tax=Actinoallomurus sp. NBC_01490 TaxID=2903557 RepID=UPI002E349C32|nr:sialidase family protein [Actinoallomurus sp. NBC_01490]
MSTTGNGASSPGDFFGGGAASERSGPAAGPPPSGRNERRRITERLAEAADALESSRLRGMPNTSPWQRSNAVWHQAGIDWSRAETKPRPPRPAASAPAPAAPPTAPHYPAPVPQPRPPAEPAVPATGPATGPTTGPTIGPGDAASADAEPWTPSKRRRRLPSGQGLPLRAIAVGVVAVLVVGGGAYLLFGRGGGGKKQDGGTPAVAADRLFALDPAAATGGRVHTLDGVASGGTTTVAFGSEQGGVYSRAQFLTSADGGRTWKLAKVRAADGGDPPQGEYPGLLAGGNGKWAALGTTRDAVVGWTSTDARTWTRRPPAGAFGPGDQVRRLARTASGFVAVGTATVHGGTQAVIWTSADGATWTRLGGDRFQPPSGGTAVSLSDVAAHGDVVVAHGRVRTTKTVTRRVRGKRRKTHRTAESEAFWRSPDGGRTWARLTVPQGQGSSGDVVGVVATQTGFFAAREASRTSGRKRKKKTTAYGAFFGSADGENWAAAGTLAVTGYSRIGLVRGTDNGLTVLVPVKGGKTAVMTSGDAKTWRHVGDLAGGRTLTGAALTPQGPVVSGRSDDGGAYLTMAGVGDVNLAAIPDAVHPERTVDGVVADAGRVVAVGSTNGRAALWTSADAATWTRAKLPASKDTGQQRLVDAVHGGPGWLAVGGTGSHPLVLTSGDTVTWQPAQGRTLGGDLVPSAAAASGSAYVVVGTQGGTSAAAWTSADLKTWTHGASAGKGDLTGDRDAPKWMSDVAAGPNGFVAVGGQTKNKVSQPALWTSPDGRRWTLSTAAPALPNGTTQGSLTKVVARGAVLVATGVAGAYAFASVSTDGGRTWQPTALPGAAPGARVTAATATSRGFVLAGTAGSDVATWSSADGRTWRATRPHGLGLDGPGVQELDGLTVLGANLLAVGFTGDQRTDGPTLWRTPTP